MLLELPADIEVNAEAIIRSVGHESVVVYRFLCDRYRHLDPRDDPIYQFVFRSFYRLDNAGLTPEFKSRFFHLLSEARAAQRTEIETIVRELFEMPNRKGQASLQFSFATKLANAIDPACPIYDAEVATIFGFRPPYTYKSFEQRLDQYMDFYGALKDLYRSIIDTGRLLEARTMFRALYKCSEAEVPDAKVLDFIFWSAGKLSREVSR